MHKSTINTPDTPAFPGTSTDGQILYNSSDTIAGFGFYSSTAGGAGQGLLNFFNPFLTREQGAFIDQGSKLMQLWYGAGGTLATDNIITNGIQAAIYYDPISRNPGFYLYPDPVDYPPSGDAPIFYDSGSVYLNEGLILASGGQVKTINYVGDVYTFGGTFAATQSDVEEQGLFYEMTDGSGNAIAGIDSQGNQIIQPTNTPNFWNGTGSQNGGLLIQDGYNGNASNSGVTYQDGEGYSAVFGYSDLYNSGAGPTFQLINPSGTPYITIGAEHTGIIAADIFDNPWYLYGTDDTGNGVVQLGGGTGPNGIGVITVFGSDNVSTVFEVDADGSIYFINASIDSFGNITTTTTVTAQGGFYSQDNTLSTIAGLDNGGLSVYDPFNYYVNTATINPDGSAVFANGAAIIDTTGNVTAASFIKTGGTSSQVLLANGATNAFIKGSTTLVSGTKAVTISGLTTSNQAFVQLTAPGGTLGAAYKAVCTTNTLTITAVSVAGVTVATDTSTLNYVIY